MLELTVKWPKPLVDIDLINIKWLKIGGDSKTTSNESTPHPRKTLGFLKKVRMLRQDFENTPESVARFGLLISVQSQIVHRYNLTSSNN